MTNLDPAQMKKVLALLFVGVLMGALDLSLIGPALPAIQAEFDLSGRQLSWLFNIYVLFQLVSVPLLAKLSDRHGRRSIYIFSLAMFALGSFILITGPSANYLLLGRAIQGFGAGGIFPVASAVIADTFPKEKQGGALGLMGAVFGLAFLVGPPLGGIFLQFAWQWLFLINLPIAAVLIFFAWRLLPSQGTDSPLPFDLTGAVFLSAALTCLSIGVTNLDSANLSASLLSMDVAPWLIALIVLVPLVWWAENRADDPIVKPGFFDSRQIRLTVIIATGIGTVESAQVFFPKLAVLDLGVSVSTAAFLMMWSMGAMAISAPLVGMALNKVGSKFIVQTGLALVCIGVGIYALIPLTTFWFIAGGVIGGIGLAGLLGAPLRYIMLNEVGKGDQAAVQGLLTVFLAVGQMLGASIVGGVAASRGDGLEGYKVAMLVLAVITGIMVIVATALKSKSVEQAAFQQ
jgi:multidrug resistance protein